MAHGSSLPVLVLHTIGLKGVAGTGPVAVATGLPGEEVDAVAGDLAEAGLVERRRSAPAGWALTGEGRRRRTALVAEELDAVGGRPAVAAVHREFVELNPDLLALCTDWQLRPGTDGEGPTTNDHLDGAYDRAVVRRLGEVHQRVLPLLGDLEAVLARWAAYRRRLGTALSRVQAGDATWFTGPLVDSYHTVWFELHQDLLVTLGIDRASPAARGAA